jgi:hypothetical protein
MSTFFSENVIGVTMNFTWMIRAFCAIMRLFFQNVCVIFNTLVPTLSKTLCTNLVKIPCLDYRAYHENFVSFHCHLRTSDRIVHLLQGHTGESRRVPGLGCEQDEDV